jgi:ABC-type multidrug transport system fused ATPase/permease subunit
MSGRASCAIGHLVVIALAIANCGISAAQTALGQAVTTGAEGAVRTNPDIQPTDAGVGSEVQTTGKALPCDPAEMQPSDDRYLYYFFIYHVGYEDDRIHKLEADGKDASKVRLNYGQMVRLSEDQVTQMLTTTLDGYRSIRAKEAEMRAKSDAFKAAHTSAERRAMWEAAEKSGTLQPSKLEVERWELVDQTMTNLRSALGEDAYATLKSWIIGEWGPRVTVTSSSQTKVKCGPSSVPSTSREKSQ